MSGAVVKRQTLKSDNLMGTANVSSSGVLPYSVSLHHSKMRRQNKKTGTSAGALVRTITQTKTPQGHLYIRHTKRHRRSRTHTHAYTYSTDPLQFTKSSPFASVIYISCRSRIPPTATLKSRALKATAEVRHDKGSRERVHRCDTDLKISTKKGTQRVRVHLILTTENACIDAAHTHRSTRLTFYSRACERGGITHVATHF